MSIEKMELVNIVGMNDELDGVLVKCCQSNCFHIESASQLLGSSKHVDVLSEDNPYTQPLRNIISLASAMDFKLTGVDYDELEMNSVDELDGYIKEVTELSADINARVKLLSEEIAQRKHALRQLKHLKGLDVDFEKLFACEHIKIRFGKLPFDSYKKLDYYSDKPVFFFTFDNDSDYYWGLYMVPAVYSDGIDDIFKSLYFERVRIPDFVKGTASNALEEITEELNREQSELDELHKQIKTMLDEHQDKLNMAFSKLKYLHDNFDLRRYVTSINGKFYLVGFVPEAQSKKFIALFDEFSSVSVVMKPPELDGRVTPPTKLKNGLFSRPFSMFVEMYGLPEYGTFNPTLFVAITYTLMFGIMFGDLGQGLVLTIGAAILAAKTHNKLAQIAIRLGISSSIFGLVYGSVFGNEELLTPMYLAMGFKEKPFEVLDRIPVILGGAIAIGVLLILTTMIINIITGFKNADYERAVFGNSGICGLTFFGSLIGGALGTLLGAKVFSVPYVLGLIILPLILMFLREPLGCLMKKKKYKAEGIGDFIASNFFEVFEFLLGYATNTLSFIRIGGFVLSHAAMMKVVVSLAEMASAGGSPVVMVLGNIFVMAMEGMLVGIQVLRLQYYEMFSRYYTGGGRPFEPVKVNFSAELE